VLALHADWSGHPVEGVAHARDGLRHLDGPDDGVWKSMTLWALADNLFFAGDFNAALAETERALEAARAARDPRPESYARWTLGLIRAASGQGDDAIAECLAAIERAPDPLTKTIGNGYLAFAHVIRGDGGAALPLLEALVEQARAFELRQIEGWYTTLLAEAHLLAGQLPEADDLARRGIALCRDTRYAAAIPYGLWVHGRTARATGRLAEARELLAEAVRLMEEIQGGAWLGRTLVDLGGVESALGLGPAAERSLERAAQIFAVARLEPDLEKTAWLLGALRDPDTITGRPDRAEPGPREDRDRGIPP
jgi:tetratricopeptide (TPR) repeat protein